MTNDEEMTVTQANKFLEKVDFNWAYELIPAWDKNYSDRQDEDLDWFFYDFSFNYQIELMFKQMQRNPLERG